eukprot:983491-Pelagomonas_calceolata.AAC.3
MMKIGGPQITLQSSDHPKRDHGSVYPGTTIFTPTILCVQPPYNTSILHIQLKTNKGEIGLLSTPCAGFPQKDMAGNLYLTNHWRPGMEIWWQKNSSLGNLGMSGYNWLFSDTSGKARCQSGET